MYWQDTHTLVHYTKSAEIVGAILKNGFMLVPNRRGLANRLLGTQGLFKAREPQQFGMVSFSELPREQARTHREQFGEFGIVVRWEWALQNHAQRVLYLGDDGPVMNAFNWLFQRARQQLEEQAPEEVTEAHLANKFIAGLYGQMYHHLLTLYEYMEPDKNSSQVEWRIVNQMPYHHAHIADREALMAECVEHASHGFGTLKIRPVDVEALLCPVEHVRAIRNVLPPGFSEVPILSLTQPRAIATLWNNCIARFRLLTRRRPRIILQPPAAEVNPQITKTQSGMYKLPGMKKLGGILAYPDDVLERAQCEMQYDSASGDTCELAMPLTQTIRLWMYLTDMMQQKEMGSLVRLAIKHEKAAMAKERSDTEKAAMTKKRGDTEEPPRPSSRT